MLFSAESHFFK